MSWPDAFFCSVEWVCCSFLLWRFGCWLSRRDWLE